MSSQTFFDQTRGLISTLFLIQSSGFKQKTFTIDVRSPEGCPQDYASELLSELVEVTAKWDGACRMLFDSAYWHPVDGKMKFFKAGAAVIARLLMLNLSSLADDEIASLACRLANLYD